MKNGDSRQLTLAAIVALGTIINPSGPFLAGGDISAQSPANDYQNVEELLKSRPVIEPATYQELEKRAADQPDRIPLGTISKYSDDPPNPTALNWTFLGPRPIENDDDASGRISSIIVDPVDPDIIYLAGAQGGVWKSSDGGVNWTPLTDHLSSLASGALAFNPANSNIIYYGTGELHYSGDSQYGDGLFKTTDAGNTWAKIAEKSVVGSYISSIIVSSQDQNIIHLGSNFGYLRSTDGGSTWSNLLNQFHCNSLAKSPADPSVIFAAIHSYGIYKSTDDGASWTQLLNGLPTSGFRRIDMAISQNIPDVIYAGFIADDGSLYGMYKTTNAGANWFDLPNTPNYVRYQGWYDNCVIVDPLNPDICYAGGVFPYDPETDYGLILTTDGGESWTDINIGENGQVHPDHHCLAIGSDGALWDGCDGGIWKTYDQGTNWINCNHDLGITQFYTVAIHPTDSNFLLGGTQDNGTARFEGGFGWPQVSAGDGGPSAVEWDSPNIYYTTYVFLRNLIRWDDNIYYTTYVFLRNLIRWDDGVYQDNVTGPWTDDRASWCNGALEVDPNQPNTLLAGTHRVYRTTNSGTDWTLLSGDLTNGGHLRSMAIAQGYSDIIYTGSSDGQVYFTSDASSWYSRDSGLPNSPITTVIINPANWQNVYLCADRSSGGRVYSTINAGISWNNETGDLPAGLRGRSLAVDFNALPPALYLGTDYGVYSSIDGGTTWIKDSANLPNVEIYDMRIDSYNNLLTVATHGRGMYRSSLTGSQEIPTLSEWGMLIMGLLLLAMATAASAGKRKVAPGKAA
jgi:photosystem II stability/assembly factor-like uncharacterized protein